MNAEFACNKLYSWPLANNFKVNFLVFCKSSSVYVSSMLEVIAKTRAKAKIETELLVGVETLVRTGVWASVRVWGQGIAGVRRKILLSLVGALLVLQ